MEAIDERSIREQLAAILASSVFVQAERLRRFLHFVVEETLQGRGDRLKEFVVGIEVFGKTDSFDPRTDATVRVQAGRLRSKLLQYYADAPRGAVVIELPKGSYTPLFSKVRRSSLPAAAHEPAPPVTQSRIALAVLKFEDHSANRDQEYFCRGITEELIAALTKVDRLRVVAWVTDRQFQQGYRDFLTIGEKPNIDIVVEGSVRKKDNHLRIAAHLIRVEDRSYLWSEIYDRELQDIFVIQDEISSAIVDTLKVQLAIGPARKRTDRATNNLTAYKLYLKGRYYWNRRSERDLKVAVDYFEKAIEQEPNYALAFAGLSDTYTLLGNYGALQASEVRPRARAAALRSVEIDDTLAEAHASVAHVIATYDWNWAEAERHYERALALNPSYATAYHWSAITSLSPMGLLDEAISRIQEAQALDPSSVSINRDAAVIMYYRREYDRVIQQCQQTLELNSKFWGAYWVLGLAYQAQSRFKEAITAFRQGLSLSGGSPRMLGALGHVYGLANERESAKKAVDGLAELATTRYVSPFETGYVHAGMGEIEIAIEWFQKAVAICCFDMIAIAVDPRFDRVREHPRFQSLLQQIRSARPSDHGIPTSDEDARLVARV